MIDRKELIEKFLEFFKSKTHKEIPNTSLIPESDSSVLFTTAGMHPLVPYLLGQKHPLGKKLCNVQRCVRTGDIEEVGDTYHHTFFEMLGNWSLGDYWKEDTIKYSFEFLTKVLKIPKEKLAVSCFKGDKDAPGDKKSAQVWESLGISKERIVFLGKKDNFWIAGKTGPCGPDTEIFCWEGEEKPQKNFNPKDERWVEIWNDVFMEYNKNEKGEYNQAKQKNVDTGMGVERTLAILNNLNDNYLTECFLPVIKEIEKLSGKKYNKSSEAEKKSMRIIADHIKASVFIISDGVTPSNTEQGYILRRLIRRSVRYCRELNIRDSISKIANSVFLIYDDYKELQKNKIKILKELEKEEEKFKQSLERGLNKFRKFTSKNKKLSGKDSFLLYQSYGFPIEMIEEECKKEKIKFSKKDFEKEQNRHQELSKTASVGRFKSGLSDHSILTTRLHTAAHLLLSALREILKDKNIIQKGSNITPERLRLDFSFSRKLTEEEIKQIENLVNEQIKKSIDVKRKEMSLEEAKKIGAWGVFEEKYGEKVSVYIINDFSREICAGPHVKNTSQLGKFKIVKEESSSSGVRRIKAVLE